MAIAILLDFRNGENRTGPHHFVWRISLRKSGSGFGQLTQAEQSAHATLSLQQLLIRYNTPEMDRLNKSLYMMTNAVGVGEDFTGAEAAASWWQRNLRMFARIQKFAKPGARLLVIGGQGHTSILRDFVSFDQNLKSEDINSYLHIG